MKKYSEIIGLNKDFHPYYDITNESSDYWRAFIPNDKFYDLLSGVLNALEGSKSQDRKSIWMQGTYGTGKSHATGVIKRLLYGQDIEINNYISNFKDDQLKSRLNAFRKRHRVLPVVLKGVSNIINNSSFSLEIEKSVKRALKENDIIVRTELDFERMIRLINENSLNINWDKNIEDHPELKMFVSNKKELLSKLESCDNEIMQILEELSSKTQIHFSYTNIEAWLVNILNELKNSKIADKLMIYWDEFTSVLELQNTSILLSKLQDIAELSARNDVYLFVISHRRPQQSQLTTTDIDHILGRFTTLDYSMEPITTYHIIGAAIQKYDIHTWKEWRDKETIKIDEITNLIASNEGSKIKELIKDLYPIHPLTAYLSTFIARNIGSTERSIFNFLYDEKRGFTKFINENPGQKGDVFLTADYLFDFFVDEFEKNADQRFSSVLDKYRLYFEKISEKNINYLPLFKVVLLLNILYRVVSLDESRENLVIPNHKNISSVFVGSRYIAIVENCLDYFNNEQIIVRNPDNLYLVESSALPFKEIMQAVNELKINYDSIDKILSDEHSKRIKEIFSLSILRSNEIVIIDGGLSEHLIKNKLIKCFNSDYSVHIVIFISKSIEEVTQNYKIINSILQDDEFSNIIFIVLDDVLDQDTINKFIDYQARALIANRHNLKEDEQSNVRYANKLINIWIDKIRNNTVKWFLRINSKISKSKNPILFNKLHEVINEELSTAIFYSGLDTIKSTTQNYPVWAPQMAKTISEIYILADNRQDLEGRTSINPSMFTREILKDQNGQYIVNNELKFVYNIDPKHPVKRMYNEIEVAIEKMRGEVFNIGDLLKFLSQPPYGLYPNMINMAALAFLMRHFSGKLYEAGTGRPLEKLLLKDLVCHIFDYWKSKKYTNKLEVRLGTIEEKQLISELCDIFSLINIDSLNDVKWAIRDWIRDNAKYPLWVFNYDENISDPAINALNAINYFIESVDRGFTPPMIKEAIDTISPAKTDLILHLQKNSQCKALFIKWLNNIENLTIKSDQYEEIIQYVRDNMPEEIGVASWAEDKVREIVKDYFIEKPVHKLKSKFIYKMQSSHAPMNVQFIDQSDGNSIAWEWNLDVQGSNIKSTDQFPFHLYEHSGKYLVSLTVFDTDGNKDTTIIEEPIVVDDKPQIEKSEREEMIIKIKSYKGDLRKILLEIINESDELIYLLKKYLA